MWWRLAVLFPFLAASGLAQQPPYDVFPPADPPWYRVRYEASTQPDGLAFPANFTAWIPPGVRTLRGVIVHQHGCGEGSCKSGLTGAYDLHWQALARKHDCALVSPSFEQPEKADCQRWCDPRRGSDAAFQRALADLGRQSGHPELSMVPWALWGHSGGGHWAGGMVMLHPERVVAAWLRSGVPLLAPDPKRPDLRAYTLPDGALAVPLMCNLGTREGFREKDGPFSGVWPANEAFFRAVRARGGRIGVAVDPISSHDVGNQRYLAIPWLDACLEARLPHQNGTTLRSMRDSEAWLASLPTPDGDVPHPGPARRFDAPLKDSVWLPNESIARAWVQYGTNTRVEDVTPPPAPREGRAHDGVISWEADADPESGIALFLIERDGLRIAEVAGVGRNPFGRPVFQGLQYSDTPPQPLVRMTYTDETAAPGRRHRYRVITVNTVGLRSR